MPQALDQSLLQDSCYNPRDNVNAHALVPHSRAIPQEPLIRSSATTTGRMPVSWIPSFRAKKDLLAMTYFLGEKEMVISSLCHQRPPTSLTAAESTYSLGH